MVVVDCKEKSMGTITTVNTELLNLSGHKEEALVGTNIATIIPLSIGQQKHSELMRNFFYKKSTTSMINRKVYLWMRNEKGYLELVDVYIQPFYEIKRGL